MARSRQNKSIVSALIALALMFLLAYRPDVRGAVMSVGAWGGEMFASRMLLPVTP